MEIEEARQRVEEAKARYDEKSRISCTYSRGNQQCHRNEETWALHALEQARAELHRLEHPELYCDPQMDLPL